MQAFERVVRIWWNSIGDIPLDFKKNLYEVQNRERHNGRGKSS